MPGLKLWIDDEGFLHSEPGGPTVITRLLPEALTQQIIRPWSVIRHSEAGGSPTPWERLWAYWARKDISIEAHAIVEMDGTIVQTCPFVRCADNNYRANKWFVDGEWRGAISYETQDLGGATVNYTPWTHDQLESIAQLDAALSAKYQIPVQPTPGPFQQGFEGHYRFPEWSIYQGKTCPGFMRRGQFGYLMDRIRTLLAPEVPQLPPFNPEQDQWGLFGIVPLEHRPRLFDGCTADEGWVRYVQGVLRYKMGQADVPQDGVYGVATALGVLAGQSFFRRGDTAAEWGVVNREDWAWIDLCAAS